MWILKIVLGLALCGLAIIGFLFLISCIREREKRASIIGGLQFILMLALVTIFFGLNRTGFFDTLIGQVIIIGVLILGVVAFFLLFLRIGKNPKALLGTKGLIVGEVNQWDERDSEFSLNMERMLRAGPPPESASTNDHNKEGSGNQELWEEIGNLAKDERISSEFMNNMKLPARRPGGGGLGSGAIDGPGGRIGAAMALASASTQYLFTGSKIYSPEGNNQKTNMSPEEATRRIKGFTLQLGADLVGIAEVNPTWYYSNYGMSGLRSEVKQWGKEVDVKHRFAIVYAEEMTLDMVGASPHTPIFMESMRNYTKGAFIGIQLAAFISSMGYPARVNMSQHYDALMVPLAVDAGLGELSRMGYLMSKEYGPRMRLSAVTTDLPLIPDKPVDMGIKDFCMICKKCADCCPSKSISGSDPEEVNGSIRWKLNARTCFEYWQKVGTDCGICMRVCPWAHARTLPHKIIVAAVSRNKYSRILFNRMDNIFFGSKPKAKAPPKWAEY